FHLQLLTGRGRLTKPAADQLRHQGSLLSRCQNITNAITQWLRPVITTVGPHQQQGHHRQCCQTLWLIGGHIKTGFNNASPASGKISAYYTGKAAEGPAAAIGPGKQTKKTAPQRRLSGPARELIQCQQFQL